MNKFWFSILFLFPFFVRGFALQDNVSGGIYTLDYSDLLLYDEECTLFNPLMMHSSATTERSYFMLIKNRLDLFFLKNNTLRLRYALAFDLPFNHPKEGRFRHRAALSFSLFPDRSVHLYGGVRFYHLVEGFSSGANIPATEGYLGIQGDVHKKVSLFAESAGGYALPFSGTVVEYGPGPVIRGEAGLTATYYNDFSTLKVSLNGGWYGLKTHNGSTPTGSFRFVNDFWFIGPTFDFTIAAERAGATLTFEYLYTKRIDASHAPSGDSFLFEQELISTSGTLFVELEDDNGRFYLRYTFAATMNNMSDIQPYGYTVPEYTRHFLVIGFLIRFETEKRKPWNQRNRRPY